jgi:ABC-type antimicrobial peptide transport system permease subunit
VIATGRALLIWRLVIGDVKRRRVQSLLLVVMIVTTTTTLTLGLALHHTSQSPFVRTRAATKGPDLVASNGPAPGSSRPSPTQFAPLIHARAVAATAGPFPVAFTRLTAPGINVAVDVEGRDHAPAAVDRPLLTAGHWVSSEGAVIEQGLASSLGRHVGDTISLGGHKFRVVGIALTTAQPFYPAAAPGLVWLTRTDAEALATPSEPLGYVLDIKLARGTSAHALDAASNSFARAANLPSIIEPWQAIRSHDYRVIALDQKVLLIGSWLLAMLAVASIAVVVGGRMAEQTRRVGLLKAVGGTPALVAAVLLAENLLLALAAAVIGLVAGGLLAPVLASPGDGLLGAAPAPSVTLASIALVIVATVVAAAATLAPALRGARTSTIRALHEPAHPPRRRPLVISLSAALPVPLLLGLRLVARRTRRTVLTAASLMMAVTMVVAALTVQRDLEVTNQGHVPIIGVFTNSAIVQSANHVLLVLSVILVTLAAISAIFTAWATVIDAQTATALARALGATPRQISAGLTTAQLLPGLIAGCVGIPAGLLLYQLAGGNLNEAQPPLLWLLAVIPATLMAVAAVTAIPAQIGARRPVAEVLRTD